MTAMNLHTIYRDNVQDFQSGTMTPAFYDMESGNIFVSRYSDGRVAPIHIYDGLPSEIIERADINVISGFLKDGEFMTREQAAEYLAKQAA